VKLRAICTPGIYITSKGGMEETKRVDGASNLYIDEMVEMVGLENVRSTR